MNRAWPIAATVVALIAAAQAGAQTADPWRLPGRRAGDEIVGPNGAKMVWVPAGSFMMGGDDRSHDDVPPHRVNLSGFWIGRTPVTVGQWCAVMRHLPDGNAAGDDHPVVNVSWLECEEFCQVTGVGLPSEAQWEYAARGPNGHLYPWGDGWDETKCWNSNARASTTAPVWSVASGSSWCGALHMAGNVWEWCSDWYASNHNARSPATNPDGPASGRTRVVRGGSWASDAGHCRSAERKHGPPDATSLHVGFRVCMPGD